MCEIWITVDTEEQGIKSDRVGFAPNKVRAMLVAKRAAGCGSKLRVRGQSIEYVGPNGVATVGQ